MALRGMLSLPTPTHETWLLSFGASVEALFLDNTTSRLAYLLPLFPALQTLALDYQFDEVYALGERFTRTYTRVVTLRLFLSSAFFDPKPELEEPTAKDLRVGPLL